MLEYLSQPFFIRALLGGIAIAIMCSWLGIFVVMKRMSFLADALAHGSLAGIALGFLLGVEPIAVAIIASILLALGMSWLERRSKIHHDTVIGVFFAGSLAIGVVLLSFIHGYRPDLSSFLFGNILAVTQGHLIATIAIAAVVSIGMQIIQWPLVLMTLDPDGARLHGLNVALTESIFTVFMATAIVISIKTVGLILVTALIVIPAASARNTTSSFGGMRMWSTIYALLSVIVGLVASAIFNIPSGASIVLVSLVIFAATLIVKRLHPRIV